VRKSSRLRDAVFALVASILLVLTAAHSIPGASAEIALFPGFLISLVFSLIDVHGGSNTEAVIEAVSVVFYATVLFVAARAVRAWRGKATDRLP